VRSENDALSAGVYADVVIDRPVLPPLPLGAPPEHAVWLELPAVPTAPRVARVYAVTWASAWGVDVDQFFLQEIVSELVTNGVLATADAGIVGGSLVMGLEPTAGGEITVTVWDPAPAPAELVALDEFADGQHETGRGLMIVAALCKEWELMEVPVGTQVRAVYGAVA
jgi:anti-sigma regulatory factor (Ser/Thr protein kinase)